VATPGFSFLDPKKPPPKIAAPAPAAPAPIITWPTGFVGFQQEAGDPGTTGVSVPQDVIDRQAAQAGYLRYQAEQNRITQLVQNSWVKSGLIAAEIRKRANELRNNPTSQYSKLFRKGEGKAAGLTDEEIDRRFASENGINTVTGPNPQLVADFQKKFGLPVTGEYNTETQAAFRNMSRFSTFLGGSTPKGDKNAPLYAEMQRYLSGPGQYLAKQQVQAKAAREEIFAAVKALQAANTKRPEAALQAATEKQTQALLATAGGQTPAAIRNLQAQQGKRGQEVDAATLTRVLGVKGKKSREKAIKQLLDASAKDDFTAIQVAQNLKQQVEAAKQESAPAALDFAGEAMETVFEPLQRAYYAGQRARNQGLGVLGETRAFVGGLPGLGFTAGSGKERRAIEDTNTWEERAKLTERGQLASFGEVVSGKAEDVLKGKALKNYRENVNLGLGVVKGPDWLRDIESPSLDLAFQVLTDPTMGVSIGMNKLSRPFKFVAEQAAKDAAKVSGDEVARAAVTRFVGESGAAATKRAGDSFERNFVRRALEHALDETPTGRALQNSIDDTLRGSLRHDVADVKRAFRGLPLDVAERVAGAKTAAEARAALREAVLDGSWSPNIRPLQTQARVGLGIGPDMVGRTAVRPTDRLAALRNFARGAEGRAAAFTHDASKIGAAAITTALHEADPGIPKFVDDFADRVVNRGGDAVERAVTLLDLADKAVDNPGFAAYVDQRVSPMFGAKGQVDDAVLDEVEMVAAIMDGEAGEAAARRMELELAQGFRAEAAGWTVLTGQVRSNLGLGPLNKSTPAGLTFDRKGVSEMIDELPDAVRARAQEALAKTKKAKGLRTLGATVFEALDNPKVLDELEKVVGIEADRLAAQAPGKLARGLGPKGIGRKLARGVLSITEEGESARVGFQSTASRAGSINERVADIDRVAAAFNLTDSQRSLIRDAAAKATTPEELFKVVERPIRIAGRDANLDPRIIDSLIEGVRSGYRRNLAFGVDQETGELIDGIRTAAQRIESVPTPDPRELVNAMNEELAKNGDIGKRLRVKLHQSGDISIFGFERNGKAWTIKLAAQDLHRLWKLLIVTNLHLPIIGGIAGGVSWATGGDPDDILTGAAIGIVGPTRYIWRVAGIEEKFRTILERGFRPAEWIPGISKWRAEAGIPPGLRFADYSSIRSGGNFGSEFETRFFLSPDRDFAVLQAGDRGFNEAWARTIQFQLQPDAYDVDRIMLGVKAGRITQDQADNLLAQLKNTDEGRMWLANMKAGEKGPTSWKKAIANQQRWVDSYVTSPEIAEARLNLARGEDLPKELFTKSPNSPKFVHAQVKGKVRVGNLWRNYQDVSSRLVLSKATNVMNRGPLARWTYADNYDFLTRVMHMEPERAAEQASEVAVSVTNDVMFRIDSESRFARKIDYVFPFQQPREEFLRVWTKLVARNPMRTVRVARAAALAMNNGEKVGIFREDPYTGEWVMTVPGSAQLSKLVGGFNGRFDMNLKDMFFVGNALGASGIPTLGGPYWTVLSRQLVNEFPEFFADKGLFQKWLMPYGPGSDLFRPESRRLWMGMTGSPPPWSFLDEPRIEGEFERGKIEVARSLYARNIAEGMSPDEAWPSDDEVREATKGFFKTWALVGSLSPATPRPVFPEEEQFQRVRDAATLNGVIPFDSGKFRQDFPEYAPFLSPTSEWTGPDDYDLFKNPLDALTEFSVRYRETVKYDDFKADFLQARKEQAAYAERNRLFDMPASTEREQALMKWSMDNPELSRRSVETHHRDRDLGLIYARYPKGELQDQAINRWRQQYNVKAASMPYMENRAKSYIPNPWREGRDTPHVVREVQRANMRGTNELVAVSRLSPAEQYRYWSWKQHELDLNWTPYESAQNVMDTYSRYAALKRGVLQANPILTAQYAGTDNPYEAWVKAQKGRHDVAIDAVTTEIQSVTAGMDAAAKSKQWSEYYALKDKQQTLYDMKRALMNDLYERYPELSDAYDTMNAMTVAERSGNVIKYMQLQTQLEKDKRTAAVKFVPTNEEGWYLSLPENVRKSYIETLTNRLSAPSMPKAAGKQNDQFYTDLGEYKSYIGKNKVSKLYWNMLSDFQRSLLEKNLPEEMVRQWSLEGYLSLQQLRAKTKGVGAEAFDGNAELQWAYSVMQAYDKRGGVTAPKSMAEYMNLPANPNVRSDFLAKHPELQGYLEATGYLDIPDADRFIVQNILTKYSPTTAGGGNSDYGYARGYRNGRGYGGSSRPLDVQFAFEQLRVWNRRPQGATAPETYNLWLNMPTGPDKAAYLNAHPEIGDWLKLGPMSNMPDEYQSIVRDIMQRYGYWTEQENPLGDTIQGYYSTPAYARAQYLKDHPELLAYWSALRGPEEQAIFNLTDQYFSIQDPGARKAFLAAHPEVQTHLVEGRNKRYEKFLNRVAFYMGENPELFDRYLSQQTEVLNELLRRYAEPPLMREVPRAPKGTEEGGRQRSSGPRKSRPRAS
jgi:hypothetical protein